MFAVYLFVCAVLVNALFNYLGAHDNVQALPRAKKLSRLGQFIILGAICMFVAFVQGIVQKNSEAASSALIQQNADAQTALKAEVARLEALVEITCSRLVANGLASQHCPDKVRKFSSESGPSTSEERILVRQDTDVPVRTETAFLRNSMPGIQLSNPFSKPPLTSDPWLTIHERGHVQVSAVETVSVIDDRMERQQGVCVTAGYGELGGDCMDSQCRVQCVSSSTLTD